MAITKYIHTVNIDVGISTTGKILEFGKDFLDWLYANMPGGEVMAKNTQTPNVDLASRAWNTVTGTAQNGGSANTIKLASGASSTNGYYVGLQITLTGGPGAGDVRNIIAYDGSTKLATVDSNFSATPTSATTYSIKETWVPDWLKAAFPDSNNYRYVTGAITFTHAESQSDWVICTTYDGSTTKYGAVIIGIRNNAASGQVVYGEITRFQPDTIDNVYLNHNETLTLLIADKTGAYKIFAKDANPSATSGNTYYYGVVRLDSPIEPTDVNAWFMFGQNDATKTRFTRQFNAEALGQICEVTCDTLIPESTNFTKNYYNQKIPLARVWAGVADLGMRGYTTNLVIVPQSFIVSNQFYTINGESYYGLGTFDNHIQLPGGGANVGQRVLLKA